MSPYKRYNPASEEDMEKRMKGDNTLCNILREMYRMSSDSEIMLKLRIAFSMGKAMCGRLTFYKEKYGFQQSEVQDGVWIEFRKRDPIDVSEMDKKRWEGHRSICQTIRDIYHLSNNEELRLKCRVALSMTKAMHERLKEYKAMEVQNVSNSG